MAANTLNQLLQDHVAGIEAVRRATVTIDRTVDPTMPGRVAYRLSGRDREAVRQQAAKILQDAAEAGGHGRFIGPGRTDDGWGALGEVITAPATAEVG